MLDDNFIEIFGKVDDQHGKISTQAVVIYGKLVGANMDLFINYYEVGGKG